MDVFKTSDPIQIKINMPNNSLEPSSCAKAQNEDLKDMDVLCTFKIKKERQNLEHGCIKDQLLYPNQDQDKKLQSGTSTSSKTQTQDIMDIDVLCTFKIKIES